jgi:aldehyde dehydrogenase (NAD+)
MGSISYALAAGNTVVFKPSEYTPAVGKFLADSFLEATALNDVFICVTGLGETGKYLCESGVNKLAFTGSTATARKVAATCALSMTPVILECGGKDPVIVDRDADLKRAADATIWSAMSNAGQTCIGAERVYVHQDVAEEFIEHCLRIAAAIKPGEPGIGNYGPATMPTQIAIIERHIKDAIAKGGRVLMGGVESVHAPYVDPVIIADVPEDSTAITEETFGPTLVINRVATMQEAIALTNASRYGLGASVWSKRNGKKIARSLACGMVSINSVIAFAAVASIPFGGVKDSGYGRIHGPEGILEFTYARSVVRTRFYLPLAFTSFRRTAGNDKLIVRVNKILKGRLG